MEIPEELRELVDRLGQALVQALVTDDQCREIARLIQESGFEVGLMIEATLALHRRDTDGVSPLEESDSESIPLDETIRLDVPEREGPTWSEEDRTFLQKFKISLD